MKALAVSAMLAAGFAAQGNPVSIDMRDFGDGVRRQYGICYLWRFDNELHASCQARTETPLTLPASSPASAIDRMIVYDGAEFVERARCLVIDARDTVVLDCFGEPLFADSFE